MILFILFLNYIFVLDKSNIYIYLYQPDHRAIQSLSFIAFLLQQKDYRATELESAEEISFNFVFLLPIKSQSGKFLVMYCYCWCHQHHPK